MMTHIDMIYKSIIFIESIVSHEMMRDDKRESTPQRSAKNSHKMERLCDRMTICKVRNLAVLICS